MEGRKVFPCTTEMVFFVEKVLKKITWTDVLIFKQTLRECTQGMDDIQWNSYLVISNRARSVCYAARQQQFRALTQMTVNKLMTSSSQQLSFIRELKAEQEELGSLAADTLTSLTHGQEKLLEQQNYLKATQQMASQQISSTLRELSRYLTHSFVYQFFYFDVFILTVAGNEPPLLPTRNS